MMNVRELANRLRVSLSKAYDLVRRNEISHYKIGGTYRVSEEQLQEYLRRVDSSVLEEAPAAFRHITRLGG